MEKIATLVMQWPKKLVILPFVNSEDKKCQIPTEPRDLSNNISRQNPESTRGSRYSRISEVPMRNQKGLRNN